MSNNEYTILPEYAPLFPKLPYHYKNYQKISVYCRGNEEAIRKFLPSRFEYLSDVFEVFVLRNDDVSGLDPYSEGGVVIPCSYKGIDGAYMAYEYVNTDDSLCAGREIWGYPKKLGIVTFEETDETVHGTITRKGKKIIDIKLNKDNKKVVSQNFFPRLQVKRIPKASEYGTDIDQVIKNVFEGSVIHKKVTGSASASFEFSKDDPIAELGPVEVIGGQFVVGDFTLTYGTVIDEL